MIVRLANQLIDQLEKNPGEALRVQQADSKRSFVILSDDLYQRVRPFIDYVAAHAPAKDGPAEEDSEWSESLNKRRVELIHKKHDSQLTSAERAELDELQERDYRHRSAVAPVGNPVLEAVLQALEKLHAQNSIRG